MKAPKWMLIYTKPITLTLSSVFTGDADGPVGVFMLDMRVEAPDPSKVGIHASHIRNMVDSLMLNRTYTVQGKAEGSMDLLDAFLIIHFGVPIRRKKAATISRRLFGAVKYALNTAVFLSNKVRWGREVRASWAWRLDEDDKLCHTHLLKAPLLVGSLSNSVNLQAGKRRGRAGPFEADESSPMSDGSEETRDKRAVTDLFYLIVDIDSKLDSSVRGRDFTFFSDPVAGEKRPPLWPNFMWTPSEMTVTMHVPWYAGDPSEMLHVWMRNVGFATESGIKTKTEDEARIQEADVFEAEGTTFSQR